MAQFIAKQKVVQWNQDDPIRQADNADEQEPDKHTATNVSYEGALLFFDCVSRKARGTSAATMAGSAVNPSNQ